MVQRAKTRQINYNLRKPSMLFVFALICFLPTILGQKCYSPLKPFPKLWGYEVDDTEVQSFAVNTAGSEFYLGILTKE